jgi:L-fucose/D-arabinose isomerase
LQDCLEVKENMYLAALKEIWRCAPIEELKKTTWCYPHEFIKADIDYEKFFQTINSNHLHTVYGSYCKVLEMFCKMKGIEYMCYNMP